MAKGTEKKLLLKRKLLSTKDNIVNVLTRPDSDRIPLNVRTVYQQWLGNINELIAICEERNKF